MKILMTHFATMIRLFLVAVFVMLFSNSVVAQTNIHTEFRTFTGSQISSTNNDIEIKDSEITAPNHVNVNPKTTIKLIADSDNGIFQWTKTKIELNIFPYKSDGQLDIDNSSIESIEVEYNPIGNSANFIDLSSIQIANFYGVNIQVISVLTTNLQTNTTSTTINPNIKLELTFETERYYLLSNELAFINPTFLLDTDNSPAALKLEWQNIKGAVEYELEWTWIDNYSDVSNSTTITTLGADLINLTERDFELNNTRVRVKNTNYEIPLIYSKGYIIYRVRALGKKLNDITNTHYGLWSSGTDIKEKVVDWTDSYIEVTQEHENKKNWQFQASYAEDGKKKEVVSYFDGSLRNRQTVTKVNTDNNAVVGEVIYDTQGRAAIEVLPVPLYNKKYIRYFENLNKNAAGTAPFTHLDFDWETGVEDVCNSTSLGMNTSSGASNYYSSQSAFLASNSPFVTNVPDAFTFPYSQTEYTPDNTGRIVRKGGVGPRHKLGSGQEMEYIYTVPKPEELNRLFGYQVGNANRYKKNIVKDPNKQVSVSYIDPQGRTIATALTPLTPLDGETETKLELLDDANNAGLHQTITTEFTQ